MKKQLKRFTLYFPVNAAYLLQAILNLALNTRVHETLNQTDQPPFLSAVIAYPGNSIFNRLRRQPVHPLPYPAVI